MVTATETTPGMVSAGADLESDIPPLQSGDRMSRAEFERRYHAMGPEVRAELIEGVVFVASPVSKKHSQLHFDLAGWAAYYCGFTPGLEGGSDATVRLDLDNEPQPDILLRISPDHGGRSGTSEDDYFEGAPEFVLEVAASSVSYDLHDKLRVYRRNGVLEYVVWRVRDRALDWFVLREGQFVRLMPSTDGLLRSEVFPGLWLDAQAVLRRDMAAVYRGVQDGLASPEHAAFVAKLAAEAARIAQAAPAMPQEPRP